MPGTNNGNVINFSSDVLAYLPLKAGTYTFGVAVGATRVDSPPDNGYELFCGANPRDRFSTVVGQYSRTTPNFNNQANTNTFTFVAPLDGVYPFRLVQWSTGSSSQSDLVWYYVDPVSGTNILINDPTGSIPGYRVSTIPREPYVAEVYPGPGAQGVAAATAIKVVLSDDNLQVGTGANGPKLYLNGAQVTPNSVTKSGTLTTILYNPNATRSAVTNNVTLVYSDNASPTPQSFTNNWAFTITVGGAAVPPVTGQWDFNGNLKATVGTDLAYFDGPTGQTAATVKFGTCSSFGIPLINGVDTTVMYMPGFPDGTPLLANYGFMMTPQIAPNGGGTLVNQYTIIYDLYWQGGTIPFFNCQNTNQPHGTDGSLFLQGSAMGQGGSGYTMNHTNVSNGWHRLAFAVDLSQSLITKWVDGVKAQDWVSSANGLDAARRALQANVVLFGDNDGPSNSGDDHSGTIYVSSIQIRNGKLSDAEMVLLGAPSASKIPQAIPASNVTGQWDFKFGDISATIGKDLTYFDGPTGQTAATVQFTNCSSAGIPLINGQDTTILYVPGFPDGTPILANYGFMMTPLIAPNGGGTLVNQYTIIYDLYWPGSGVIPFFNCQNTNQPHGTDGSLFLQGNAMGQGGSGYTMNHTNVSAGWHRLAFAVDLSQNLITKWVDGVKAQDWVSSANGLDAARRALQANVVLFGDNDGPNNSGDDHSTSIYVSSIQIRNGKMSDAAMALIGAPTASKIPVATPTSSVTGQWDFNYGDLSATIGRDLTYFDGPTGQTAATVQFTNALAAGVPLNGGDAKVLYVPGFPDGTPLLANYGFMMTPLISPNGGGTLVNQYTIIWDMYWPGSGVIPFFNCQNTNQPHGTDGSLFLQGNAMGQGGGGYNMPGVPGGVTQGWHRLAFAVDLSQQLITKWVDGVKADDWVSSANGLDAARRALQANVVLFGDNDGPNNSGDDHSTSVYVKSIQINNGKLSDAYMEALGGPSASGIPLYVAVTNAAPPVFNPPTYSGGSGPLTITWTGGGTLYEATNIALPFSQWTQVPGNPNGSYTVYPATNGVPQLFYRVQ